MLCIFEPRTIENNSRTIKQWNSTMTSISSDLMASRCSDTHMTEALTRHPTNPKEKDANSATTPEFVERRQSTTALQDWCCTERPYHAEPGHFPHVQDEPEQSHESEWSD